jgi:hypothetical protein
MLTSITICCYGTSDTGPIDISNLGMPIGTKVLTYQLNSVPSKVEKNGRPKIRTESTDAIRCPDFSDIQNMIVMAMGDNPHNFCSGILFIGRNHQIIPGNSLYSVLSKFNETESSDIRILNLFTFGINIDTEPPIKNDDIFVPVHVNGIGTNLSCFFMNEHSARALAQILRNTITNHSPLLTMSLMAELKVVAMYRPVFRLVIISPKTARRMDIETYKKIYNQYAIDIKAVSGVITIPVFLMAILLFSVLTYLFFMVLKIRQSRHIRIG